MNVTRRTLFESQTLQIGWFEACNVSNKCGDVERQNHNVVVLPFSGVFSKHDAPGRYVIGTPAHAVFIAAGQPYRLGYPGAIGDRALILRFEADLALDDREAHDGEVPASNGLLTAEALLLRNLLRARLKRDRADEFEIEAHGLDLLSISLSAMRPRGAAMERPTSKRWIGALHRIKEAVAAAPADKWSVEKLAYIASLSPFHLCRVFRRITGISIYDYVLRERLASTLDSVLDGGDLTTVALDAGFASHSHFTARFRAFFGCTPTTLRRRASAGDIGELRKIVTALRSAIDLD